jgi:hypothetical protein
LKLLKRKIEKLILIIINYNKNIKKDNFKIFILKYSNYFFYFISIEFYLVYLIPVNFSFNSFTKAFISKEVNLPLDFSYFYC